MLRSHFHFPPALLQAAYWRIGCHTCCCTRMVRRTASTRCCTRIVKRTVAICTTHFSEHEKFPPRGTTYTPVRVRARARVSLSPQRRGQCPFAPSCMPLRKCVPSRVPLRKRLLGVRWYTFACAPSRVSLYCVPSDEIFLSAAPFAWFHSVERLLRAGS
jgi:hypothetical protein